jgi:hypothetical protein
MSLGDEPVMNETHQPGTLAPLVPVPARFRKSKKGLWIGLGIGLVLLCCAAATTTVFLGRNQLPAMARLFATRTARPTSTPLPTNTPLATATETPLPPTPTPKAFILTDKAFEADLKDTCNTDVQITEVHGTSFSVKGKISVRNDQMYVWCYDARHTWIGTLTYADYTFASDASDPLVFVVKENQGYVYMGGKGSVTEPDGTVVNLP